MDQAVEESQTLLKVRKNFVCIFLIYQSIINELIHLTMKFFCNINQHLYMPHMLRWDVLSWQSKMITHPDLDRFVDDVW